MTETVSRRDDQTGADVRIFLCSNVPALRRWQARSASVSYTHLTLPTKA